MYNISLIPPTVKYNQEHKRKTYNFIIISLIVFVVLLICYITIMLAKTTPINELRRLENTRILVESEIVELSQYKSTKEEMEVLESMINQAGSNTPDWKKAFDSLSRNMPAGAWLTDISFQNNNEKVEMLVRGEASNHSYGALFYNSIKGMADFEDIKYIFSTSTEVDNRNVIQFEITGNLVAKSIPEYPVNHSHSEDGGN